MPKKQLLFLNRKYKKIIYTELYSNIWYVVFPPFLDMFGRGGFNILS